jgi:UDP-glucuronate 4-epimerase
VAHLAAMAGVRVSLENPLLYVDVNVRGTTILLEASRATGVGNFVFASTSSIYGNTEQIPFVETDPCNEPLAPYAATKKAGEAMAYTYHHVYGLPVTVVRFFTVYGERGRPDMMAYKLADSITKGVQIPLYNDGQMWRDWTYVKDIASGVVAAVERPQPQYEIVNLGRGEPVLLAEFVEIIEELAGAKANLLSKPAPPTDVVRTYADVSKARRLLDYDPKISVREGVRRFWEWYAANRVD